jgi:hypothetical protein
VYDWTVPQEWNVHDAAVIGPDGTRVIDFRACNLHLMSYSVPVAQRMTLDELRPHLYTLPEQPDWIPYRTSYYTQRWGFCLTQRQLDALDDGEYEVVVDTTLEDGSLTYGECVLPGAEPGRGPVQLPRVPPVAGERQPVWHRGAHMAGPVAGAARAAVHLPAAVHPRHDRIADVAVAQRRRRRPDRPRADGRGHRRWRVT